MGALERLYAALEPLRLYRLRTDSLVDAELAAYGAGFALLEGRMETLLRNLFVETADDGALARHEQLVGLVPRQGIDTGRRRENVLYRMGAAAGGYTKEGILAALRALGMEAELIEDSAWESLEIRCLELMEGAPDLDRLKNGVMGILPAHLEIRLDIGELTWEMFEEAAIAWDDWDSAFFTWTDFDINGHNLITAWKGS